MTAPDVFADAVRAAWDAHAAAITAKADTRTIHRLYIAVLKAERALEADAMAHCTNPNTRVHYAASITEYDARIEDECRAIKESEHG